MLVPVTTVGEWVQGQHGHVTKDLNWTSLLVWLLSTVNLYWQELRYYYKCFHYFNPSQSLLPPIKDDVSSLIVSHKWSVCCELESGDELALRIRPSC